MRTLDDLQKIPVLTKEEVKANPEGCLSSDFMEKKLISQHTSGTTGGGFVFYTTSEALSAQWAIWWRYRRSLGISYGDDCAVFGGRTVVPIACRRAPYYRVNRPSRQFLFSQYHLGGSTADEYIAELRKLRVKWLHGYPSALALLAHFLLDRGESLEVDHVTLGAENLLESQESALKEAFHVSPRQHYGLSEAVANFRRIQEVICTLTRSSQLSSL